MVCDARFPEHVQGEPIYGPIRRALPQMGGLDLAPLIFIIILYAAQIIISNNMYAFAG